MNAVGALETLLLPYARQCTLGIWTMGEIVDLVGVFYLYCLAPEAAPV